MNVYYDGIVRRSNRGNLGKSFMVEDIDGGMQTILEVSNGPNGSSHVPAFLAKLWKIVDDPNTNDLICWSEMGNSFLIRNQSKFARELLPLYYKHNNMASFVRQLNMYGFHKVVSVEQGGLRTDKDEMEFAHPFFLRGSESTLELIKRKIPASKLDESRGSRPDSMNKVLQDVRQMKGRQDSMDSKLMAVKRENEALWRELSVLRQKHAKQQQIVSKLLQFLVGMMSSQSHRLGFKRRMPVTLPLMLNDTDGLKSSKRNKNQGGELVGPVIRDVTDFLSTGDRMLENQTDYVSGGSDFDTQPKVDSPGGSSITDRSPGGYAESAYPMSPYDDPEMLLSVDPMSMNPSMEIKPQPQITPPVQAQVQRRNNNVKKTPPKSTASKRGMGGQKKSITTSSTASFVHIPDQMTTTMNTEASPTPSPDTGSGGSNNQVVQNTLPTVVYLPGTDTPVQVVLSLPEATTATAVTESGGKSVGTSYAATSVPTVSLQTVEHPSASNVLTKPTTTLQNVTNPLPQTNSHHSIELSIPSPKISKENSTEADSSTEMVLAGTDNSALSRNQVVTPAMLLKPNFCGKEDFDEHLDEVQSGLDNLKELLKHDQQYSLDPNTLLTLFGNEDLFDRSAISDLKEKDNIGLVPTSSGNGGDMVSYNPTLYELADDDFFDYQNNGAFLDDELESMLTTDREKLKKGDLKNNISSIS